MESDVRVSGIADGPSAVTAMNYTTMHRLMKDNGGTTDANFVAVIVGDLDQVQTVANRIDNMRDGSNKRIFGAITVGSILKTVNTYVSLASTVLAAIAGISLLSVSERTKEIGILRALGERKKDIRRLFTSESILIGLFSAVLAMVLALITTAILNHALYGMIKYNIVQITAGNIIFAFVVAIVISFIAALLPSHRAANLNPIEALAADKIKDQLSRYQQI